MTKMTKKNVFDALINFANGGELAYEGAEGTVVIDMEALKLFAEHEIQLLDKKAAKAKETAKAKKAANDELTEAIAQVLTDEFQTIAEVTAQIEGEDVTTAKVQYRLNALVKAHAAEKGEVTIAATEGKKARKVVAYKVVAAEEIA